MNWAHILSEVWVSRWDIILGLLTFIHRKELLEAMKGGNGKWQVDEAAKVLILYVFYVSFRIEGTRTDPAHSFFSDAYWFAILGTVALIAGIKEGKNLWGKNGTEDKEQTT